ncbi:hypothetical protein CXR27_12495 [Brevibacterium aurantiacum]|uniref:Uncharacterized protein n=1 Tax=Brevibacterium aurantiacum TaxID=273384 RepID=A0A3T0DRJ3_BREAU|nr:hypothetical protein CXR27_12495 [Brevibacterium aurantiacum]
MRVHDWILSVTTNSSLGKVIDLLSLRLPPYIKGVLAPHLNGVDWPILLTELDKAKGKYPKAYSSSDLQAQLRVMTERLGPFGYPFSDPTRQISTMASELRVTRNRWAHNEPSDWFDVFRAADTAVRLFSFIGDTAGRDRAEEFRASALGELTGALKIPKSEESARLAAERRAGAPEDADLTVVPSESMTHRAVVDTPLLGDSRLPFEPWPVTVIGDRSVLDALPKKWAKERVRALIAEIVEAEGPVLDDRLATLVLRSFGLERTYAARKKKIIRQASASGFHLDKAKFLWPADMDPANWTEFRPNDGAADRPFTEISPREIGNAAVAVVEQKGRLTRAELDAEVLSTFGRKRRTKAFLKHLESGYQTAVDFGRLGIDPEVAWDPTLKERYGNSISRNEATR